VDGIQARTSVGKLNVRQDEARLLVLGKRHGICMGASHADDMVTEIPHQAFKIHCDKRLVFDDQNIGGDLSRHLSPGGIGKSTCLSNIYPEYESDFLL